MNAESQVGIMAVNVNPMGFCLQDGWGGEKLWVRIARLAEKTPLLAQKTREKWGTRTSSSAAQWVRQNLSLCVIRI